MKTIRKTISKKTIYGIFVALMLLPLLLCHTVFAGDIQEQRTIDDQSTTQLVADGQSGNSTQYRGGDSNSYAYINDSSSAYSGTISESEMNLINAKSGIYGLLYNWMGRMNQSGFGIKNNRLMSVGMTDISALEMQDLDSFVRAFTAENGNGGLYYGYNTNYGVSHSIVNSCKEFNELNDEAQEKIMKAVADQEGIPILSEIANIVLMNIMQGMERARCVVSFQNRPTIYLDIPPSYRALGPYSGMNVFGIRPDIIFGGFHDSINWINRYKTFNRIHSASSSNAFEDFIRVALYKEYAISSIQTDYVVSENYNAHERNWTVRNEAGEVIAQRITDNPKHEFDFSGAEFGVGTYTVTAQQLVKGIKGCYITYDSFEYLFDVSSGILLYADENRLRFGGGKGMYVDLGTNLDYERWVDTDEYYVVTVTEAGVENGSTKTERVK